MVVAIYEGGRGGGPTRYPPPMAVNRPQPNPKPLYSKTCVRKIETFSTISQILSSPLFGRDFFPPTPPSLAVTPLLDANKLCVDKGVVEVWLSVLARFTSSRCALSNVERVQRRAGRTGAAQLRRPAVVQRERRGRRLERLRSYQSHPPGAPRYAATQPAVPVARRATRAAADARRM